MNVLLFPRYYLYKCFEQVEDTLIALRPTTRPRRTATRIKQIKDRRRTKGRICCRKPHQKKNCRSLDDTTTHRTSSSPSSGGEGGGEAARTTRITISMLRRRTNDGRGRNMRNCFPAGGWCVGIVTLG